MLEVKDDLVEDNIDFIKTEELKQGLRDISIRAFTIRKEWNGNQEN